MSDKAIYIPKNVIPVKATLLETCKTFAQENNFDVKRYLYNPYKDNIPYTTKNSIPFYFTAQLEKPSDADGYSLHFLYNETIILPAGRYLSINYLAGHISYISGLLPLQTVKFNQAIQICQQVGKSFNKHGFEIVKFNEYINENNFGKNSFGEWELFGVWETQTSKPLRMTLTIENYNKRPPATFNMPLSKLDPMDAPITYIVSITIQTDHECMRELLNLEKARNLAVNGDEQNPIPLTTWFDDPDWRPEGWAGKWL